jgi:hypothetical protein
MTFEDPEDRTIFSLLRLRLPNIPLSQPFPPREKGVKKNYENPIYRVLPELE